MHYTSDLKGEYILIDIKKHFRVVRELMGQVRNVVLIKCTLDLGKPRRGWDFGREGTWAGEKWGS